MKPFRRSLPELPDQLWLRLAGTIVLAALIAMAASGGAFRSFEHRIEELAFAVSERPASGNIHIVEMDAASMAAIRQWPWPREHYARVLEQLDAAGVRSISFDVDFSSASQPEHDAAFAAAISASRTPVALPTFAQSARFREARQLDSLPIPVLREHAHLASVSVVPDSDGFVRRMPLGTVNDSLARPSIAAFMAGRAGSVGESFPIDFGVNPAAIPHHSFIAIERGEFDAASLKGKDVIIGATAIELGDRYLVPRFGMIPGVILQALAGAVRLLILPQRYAGYRRRIDPESGLPNKLALDSRPAVGGERYFVAVQIDDFEGLQLAIGEKNIGDLLRRLAERLQVAGDATSVYRIDTRTLAWPTPLNLIELESLLAGLRAVMRSPFEVAGRALGVSLTFGVAEADIVDAAANAAHAASLAKRSGKPWRLHADGEGEAATERFSMLGELDAALLEEHIAVVYQPKLNLATDRIDAVEALVRWNHPVRGMLPPDSFIPTIEEAGRIDDVTIAVLAQSLEDMRSWRNQGLAIGVAVNISANLLTSESFAARAMALVMSSGVPAHRLTFEVTESAQFEDSDKAIAMLERFRASGIRISMDDYGTGQSTLNYLKVLPVSELKIDRMFVQHAHVDHGDAMLVRSTVQLAHELGLKVVAEGIEEAACLTFLKGIGCDYAQGYFVSRPLSAKDLAKRVAATVAPAA